MRIVFMGTPEFAVPVLRGLIDHYEVVGVVSQPDKEVGRHKVLTETPIKKVALENHIPVFQPIKIREEYEDILALKPDMIVTCAYGQIIPKVILDCPKLGCINVHASLLPKLRGGAPIHKALIDGYDKTGITIMYMDVKMDNGDIISQKELKILDSDNLESLHDKLSVMGRDLLLETLPSIIEGTNQRIVQNEDEVTFAYNIKREEEQIDFSKTSREVFNLIRGLSPVPSAFTSLFDLEMKIYESIINDKKYEQAVCGEIVDIIKEGIVVKTQDGSIILTKIKPFGKKMMDASSYVNGVGKNKLIGKVFQ
ncbi:MAG: methionyl-tRNA formyltransferase [Bacilli bacterium]|nr:methionyl-tRNA formyltransferase [Bacilli bacterium]